MIWDSGLINGCLRTVKWFGMTIEQRINGIIKGKRTGSLLPSLSFTFLGREHTKKVLLTALLGAVCLIANSATFDLQFANKTTINGNPDQLQYDVQIKADSVFTMGGDSINESIFAITFNNRGTAAGQMMYNSISGNPAGYTFTATDNGIDQIDIAFKRTSGNFTVDTSFATVFTITFDLGSGTISTLTIALNFDTATTQVADAGNTLQTKGTFTGTSSSLMPLPVELISFSWSESPDGILLNWITASEKSNEGFWVQGSVNGCTFEKLHFETGYGNSHVKRHYSYLLEENNFRFVRLKQIDFDGDFDYSKVLQLPRSTISSLQLFVGVSDIKFASKNQTLKESVFWALYTLDGQELSHGISNSIQRQNLAPGLYLVKVETKGKSHIFKYLHR